QSPSSSVKPHTDYRRGLQQEREAFKAEVLASVRNVVSAALPGWKLLRESQVGRTRWDICLSGPSGMILIDMQYVSPRAARNIGSRIQEWAGRAYLTSAATSE